MLEPRPWNKNSLGFWAFSNLIIRCDWNLEQTPLSMVHIKKTHHLILHKIFIHTLCFFNSCCFCDSSICFILFIIFFSSGETGFLSFGENPLAVGSLVFSASRLSWLRTLSSAAPMPRVSSDFFGGVDYELPFIDDNEKLKLLQCLNIMMV